MSTTRSLIVIADDFGVGPETSKGILRVAIEGRISGAGLIVNSPYAEDAVQQWRKLGQPVELGWQPCLTMDSPILPPSELSSLVTCEGKFHSFARLLWLILNGQARQQDIQNELTAQWDRFVELTGFAPTFVTGHEHVQLLPRISTALVELLSTKEPKPYFRRIRESLTEWIAVGGGRWKRLLAATFGRRYLVRQAKADLPGNEYLAGLTDAKGPYNPEWLSLWLTWTPGQVIELVCHPGYRDPVLIERLANSPTFPTWCQIFGLGYTLEDQLQQRVREMDILMNPSFAQILAYSGRSLIAPSSLSLVESPKLRLVA